MGGVRFQSLHITHTGSQPARFEVANDYSPDVTVNGAHVGQAPPFQEGLFTMSPRPLIAFTLVTALANFVSSASLMIPQADSLLRMLRVATTDLLDPPAKTARPQVTLNSDSGNACVILPLRQTG